MRKVAYELDQLMWYLAEQGDTKAVEEFENRYPEQRYELARRIAMLRGLRGEGRKQHRNHELPVFTPVEPRRVVAPRRLVFGVGLLSLAAIAAATYTVVTFMQPAPPVTAPKPAIQESVIPPIQESDPSVVFKSPPPPEVEPQPQSGTSQADLTPKYLQPQDLKIERAPLISALQLIAAQGGVELTFGGDMPNPVVQVSYSGKNVLEMLQDLGRQYAFTAFDEGDGQVLIVPAVDPTITKSLREPESPVSDNKLLEKAVKESLDKK